MIANLEFYNESSLEVGSVINTLSVSEKESKIKGVTTSLRVNSKKPEKEKIDLSKYNNMEMKAEIISYKISSN